MVYIPVGLPGCGKTTWAREKIASRVRRGDSRTELVRLSRDDLRAMLTVGYTAPQRQFEDMLTVVFDAALLALLERRADVIVDATNLNSRYRYDLTSLVERCDARWELVDFTAVPLQTCIARDAQRTGIAHVGEQVIRDMHARYLAAPGVSPRAAES